MAEPILMRVRQILSASGDDAVDGIERSGAASVIRESIRQVDRAIDEVRAVHRSAWRRSEQASKLQEAIRTRLSDLEAKARCALGKGREDLAHAALSAQPDLEERLAQLQQTQSEAELQAGRFGTCLAELRARKTKLEKALRHLEAEALNPSLRMTGEQRERIEAEEERPKETFQRVWASTLRPADPGGDGEGSDKPAEIDAIHRRALIAERLEALGTSPPARQVGGSKASQASPGLS